MNIQKITDQSTTKYTKPEQHYRTAEVTPQSSGGKESTLQWTVDCPDGWF